MNELEEVISSYGDVVDAMEGLRKSLDKLLDKMAEDEKSS